MSDDDYQVSSSNLKSTDIQQPGPLAAAVDRRRDQRRIPKNPFREVFGV